MCREGQKTKNPVLAALRGVERGFVNEADGTRTRNIRIDSPVL